MKQAKISISADIGSLKKAIDQAKKSVEGLTKIKLSSEATNSFKKLFGDTLDKQIKTAETRMSALNKRIEQVGRGSIMDPKRLQEAIQGVDKLKQHLLELKKTKEDVNKIGTNGAAAESDPGGGSGGKGFLGQIGGVAKTLGLAIGAMAVYNKRLSMARERTSIRELGGDSNAASERSGLGFTPEERRGRMLDVQRAAGRRLNAADLGSMTDVSEKVQRAYGISGAESAGAMTTARKQVGMGSETKVLGQTIGAAVAAKLEGSRIGEFLQESSAALEDMNKNGIGVDSESLNGFAAALSTLPFFKSDPAKAFETLKNMNEAFTHGDRFQQAQAAKAIQQGAGGNLSPAAVELRREGGLFTKGVTGEDQKILAAVAPDLAKAFGISGGTLVKNLVQNAVGGTKGEGGTARIYDVKQRLGLQGTAGTMIAARLINSGGDLAKAGLDEKKFKEAQMTPEEKMTTTMENVDGDILKLNATMAQSLEKGVKILANDIVTIGKNIVDAINALTGGHASDIGGALVAGGTVAAGVLGAKSLFGGGAAAAEGAAVAGEGAAAAGGMTLGGAALGAAGVGAAGLGGYALGKYAINPLIDRFGSTANRYGSKSNFVERGMAKMIPEWAGGMDAKHYQSAYGTGEDPMMADLTGDQAQMKARANVPTAGTSPVDDNTDATSENTSAINELTRVLRQKGASGGRVGKGAGLGH